MAKLSPMMQQYFEIKNRHKDHIVFFRLGDFYEMFFDDAILASKELELTLTGRDCGQEERAPMCGIPYHSSEAYIQRLLEKGYKVAICEQTEQPQKGKTLVNRDVIRVVTPGTLIESSLLDETSNNYICSLYAKPKECAICLADISTGEVHLFAFSGKDMSAGVINELSRFSPAELLINDYFLTMKDVSAFVKDKLKTAISLLDEGDFIGDKNMEATAKQFSVASVSELGIAPDSISEKAVCGLFAYISETQKAAVGRFSKIITHDSEPIMTIGLTARRNLELTETLRNKEKKGSLLWVLDSTKTSMGKRMLKSYLEQPLVNPSRIMARLDAVEQLYMSPV